MEREAMSVVELMRGIVLGEGGLFLRTVPEEIRDDELQWVRRRETDR